MKNNIDRREFLSSIAMPAAVGIAAADARANRPARLDKRRPLTDLTAVAAVAAMRNGNIQAEDYGGILPLADAKFDQSGSLARTVGDLGLFDAALTSDRAPLRPTPLKGVRLGIAPEFLLSGLDPEVERIARDAMHRLGAAGVTWVEAEPPEIIKTAGDTVDTIMSYEGQLALATFFDAQNSGITFDQMLQQSSEDIRSDFNPAERPTQDAYQAALAQRQQIREEVGRYYEQYRIVALAFPPILIPPPPIGHEGKFSIGGKQVSFGEAMTRNTALGTCADMASLVLAAGMTSDGLPVGLEFDVLTGNDRTLLALGVSLEKIMGSIPAPRPQSDKPSNSCP